MKGNKIMHVNIKYVLIGNTGLVKKNGNKTYTHLWYKLDDPLPTKLHCFLKKPVYITLNGKGSSNCFVR